MHHDVYLTCGLLRGKVELEGGSEDVFFQLMRISRSQHSEEPLKQGQAANAGGKDFLARLNARFRKRFPPGRQGDVTLGKGSKA